MTGVRSFIRVMRYDGSGGVMGHDGMQMVVQGEMALAAHFKCIMYIQFEVGA